MITLNKIIVRHPKNGTDGTENGNSQAQVSLPITVKNVRFQTKTFVFSQQNFSFLFRSALFLRFGNGIISFTIMNCKFPFSGRNYGTECLLHKGNLQYTE